MVDPLAAIVPAYKDIEQDLANLEGSWADFHRGLRTGLRARSVTGGTSLRTSSLQQVASILNAKHDDFLTGNRAALIDALGVACEENVPLPYWLADGILAALSELHTKSNATLHSVFHMEARYPTSEKRSAKARLDWDTKLKLYVCASQLMAQGVGKVAAIKQAIEGLPIQSRTAFQWFNELDTRQQKYLRAWRGIKLHKLR